MAVPPEIAGAALDAAIEIFGRAGHTVHPGKSACWSLETPRHVLPASCQRIWHEHGLLVGGVPVYDESKEPLLANGKEYKSSKSGKASVENCSLSATPTAYNSILHFLQDLRGSSSAVGLLRLVLRSERRHQ